MDRSGALHCEIGSDLFELAPGVVVCRAQCLPRIMSAIVARWAAALGVNLRARDTQVNLDDAAAGLSALKVRAFQHDVTPRHALIEKLQPLAYFACGSLERSGSGEIAEGDG